MSLRPRTSDPSAWFSPEGRPRQFVHLGGGLLAILNLEDNRVTQRLSLLSEATRRVDVSSEGQALQQT